MLQYIYELAKDTENAYSRSLLYKAMEKSADSDILILESAVARLTIIDTDTGKVIYRSGTDLTQ